MARKGSVLVVSRGERPADEQSIAGLLYKLGADVKCLDLWDDFEQAFDEDTVFRVMVFDAQERADLATAGLRTARKLDELAAVPALIAVSPRQVAELDPSAGFDDFVVMPCVPAELYARIRKAEWTRSEFSTDERVKVGALVVDRAAHEVLLDGDAVSLTKKEFDLLAFLATNRGKVFSRDSLLSRVWGSRYDGGPRTVDIHIRRLRAKLGEAFPVETLRGSGYKLRTPTG